MERNKMINQAFWINLVVMAANVVIMIVLLIASLV